MAKDNTVKANNKADVYENDMQVLADEYLNTLLNPEMIYDKRGSFFSGMIKYINKHIHFPRSIMEDINILNNIWENYVELVYKYNQYPTLQEYCLLIGITRETLYTWYRGEYRTTDICRKLGTSRSDTIQKWQDECKSGRYKNAASGNVGGIFLCKAVDGMIETAPTQTIVHESKRTIEQIAQDYENTGIEDKGSNKPKLDF